MVSRCEKCNKWLSYTEIVSIVKCRHCGYIFSSKRKKPLTYQKNGSTV